MTNNYITEFIRVATGSYLKPENKAIFHRHGQKILKEIAARLNLNGFDLRSNKAPQMCCGEITLHGDQIYIQFGSPVEDAFMWRLCNGRKDFTGLVNNWMPYARLLDLQSVCATFNQALTNHPNPKQPVVMPRWRMVTF